MSARLSSREIFFWWILRQRLSFSQVFIKKTSLFYALFHSDHFFLLMIIIIFVVNDLLQNIPSRYVRGTIIWKKITVR